MICVLFLKRLATINRLVFDFTPACMWLSRVLLKYLRAILIGAGVIIIIKWLNLKAESFVCMCLVLTCVTIGVAVHKMCTSLCTSLCSAATAWVSKRNSGVSK